MNQEKPAYGVKTARNSPRGVLPQAHMSTGFPYGSFLSTSGDRYPGVPANPRAQDKDL